jgi:hypothetical protein
VHYIVSRSKLIFQSFSSLSATLKSYGQQLKASAALMRFRLYEALTKIPPTSFERSYTHMLRFVIWELTLNDNVANTTTSLFTRVCQSNAIFNSLLISDHIAIEDQVISSMTLKIWLF